MPDNLEQLAVIKSQTLATIVEITAQPKPSYKIDGQSVLWTQYLAQLQKTVAWCDQQMAAARPSEIRSQGFSG